MFMVHCTSCGPSTPANTPPAITHDTAFGRYSRAGAIGGGEAIGLRHRAIQSAEERRAAEQRETNACRMANAPSRPVSTPQPVPMMKATRRP